MPRSRLSPLKINALIAAVGAVSLAAAMLVTGMPGTSRSIPIPFVTGGTNLQGSVIFSETRNNLSIYDVTFNHGELSEHLRPDRVYLVHIPADSTIQNVSLDAALTASGGTHTVDYFGYRYSTATATAEIQHVSDASFSARFPAQFFASARARTTDAAHGGMLASFEAAKNVIFRPTDGTDSLIKIDPAGALYVLIVNDASGVDLAVRTSAPPASSSSSISSSVASLSFCGDGNTDHGGPDGLTNTTADNEQCDDANDANGDGCSSTCHIEPGYVCNSSGHDCQKLCGNGYVEAAGADGSITTTADNEQCDDQNDANGDGCSATCHIENGFSCTGSPSQCVSSTQPTCGNGSFDAGETCDDHNVVNGDGCTSVCSVESGFACTGAPSVCRRPIDDPVCGNGVREGLEQCDDGNQIDGDVCSNTCHQYISDPVFVCGNGVREGSEQCDDGNTIDTDTCRNDCTFPPPPPSSVCGNGAVEGSETCDDGNTVAVTVVRRPAEANPGSRAWVIQACAHGLRSAGTVSEKAQRGVMMVRTMVRSAIPFSAVAAPTVRLHARLSPSLPRLRLRLLTTRS